MKGSRAGLVSPVEVTFSEIGAIPPPRMFSDTNTITLSIKSDSGEAQQKSAPVSSMEVDSDDEAKKADPENNFVSFERDLRDSPSVTIIRDEESTKEPLDSAAVPKKSVLKKSKLSSSSVSSNIPANNSTANFSLPLPSDRYVFSFTPRPPASHTLLHPDSSHDSDSDCEDSIKWRDYYGDDERGNPFLISWSTVIMIARPVGRKNARIARKDSLAQKLAQRPDVKELMEKNILPAMTDEERLGIRERVSHSLNRRLSLRPTVEELEQRNILKTQTPEEMIQEKEHLKALLDRKVRF